MPITKHNVTTLRRSVNTALLSCAVVAAAAFVPAAAHASTQPVQTVTTKIDLRDLQTNYGIQRVYKRLTRKADTSCGVRITAGIANLKASRDCAAVLLSSFIDDLDHDRLTVYHRNMVVGA